MAGSRHDDLKIRIATIARGDRGHSKNKRVTWGRLRERLSTPEVDKKHTLPDYLNLSIDRQNRLKDVGSFVGGPFRDGLRKGRNLIERSIVTLDIDVVADSQIELLKIGVSDACKYEFFGCTTRKHTKKKPRWRLIFPLTRPVTVEEYGPLSRILASTLFNTVRESMDAVDDVSYRPAQVMYWPSVCKDALFEKIHNQGDLLDPDEVLDAFGDWRDWTLLPYSDLRGQKRPTTGKKAEKPSEKTGIIGAFCRTYDVPAAIEKFLPDVYIPGDPNSNKPRYTYVHGSSSNGAIVEDDGDFLYSHHGTDPCAERLVNSFDLVRIHLFGEEDTSEPEDTRATDLPSFKSMRKLLRDDPDVQAENSDDYPEHTPVEFSDLGEDEEEPRNEKQVSRNEKPKRRNETIDSGDEDDEKPPKKAKNAPDMSVLTQSRLRAPKFPVDVLGDFWGARAKQWATDAAAPLDYTAMALLTGAASTIGNARWVQPRPNWKEPPVLWCTLVGDPSTNKSPAMGPLASILSKLEKSWMPLYTDELRDWESEKKNSLTRRKIWEKEAEEKIENNEEIDRMPADCMEPPKPIRRRAVINDATLEALLSAHSGNPRGFLNMRDEMSSWFSNLARYNSGSDRPAWLEAYGGRQYIVDRVKNNGLPMTIDHFSVSILGGIQPERLLDLLTSADDGLQARFMYIWPDSRPKKLSNGIEEDTGAENAFRKLSELPMDCDKYGNSIPEVVPLSAKAWEEFRDWADERKEREENSLPALKGAYGKADGLVLRLALVLEHLWWAADMFDRFEAPTVVSRKAIRSAIRLREDYLKPMQQRTFAFVGKSEAARLGGLLALWIRDEKPSVIDTRMVTHKAGIPGMGYGETKNVMAAIEYLIDMNWLIPVDQPKTSKAGRPKREYAVNSLVFDG